MNSAPSVPARRVSRLRALYCPKAWRLFAAVAPRAAGGLSVRFRMCELWVRRDARRRVLRTDRMCRSAVPGEHKHCCGGLPGPRTGERRGLTAPAEGATSGAEGSSGKIERPLRARPGQPHDVVLARSKRRYADLVHPVCAGQRDAASGVVRDGQHAPSTGRGAARHLLLRRGLQRQLMRCAAART